MNPSEKFKNMAEVKEYVEAMRGQVSDEDFELFQYLFGLLENRGLSVPIEINGEKVQIDKSIAPMIEDLIDRGYQTLACCSGIQEEHPQERFRPETGYLSLAYDEKLFEYLRVHLVDDLIEIRQGEAYLKPSVSITIKSKDDAVLKDKWSFVWKVLKEWGQ